jgi:TetR/AcrR family transcriptional regulator, cholesterol catabolism regulator
VGGVTLTPRQLARRERIVRAALALAAEGGYDAVQMRDVATRADVALGTIYHYFASKDHLLAATLVHWTKNFRAGIEHRPPTGATVLERVLELLDRTTHAMRLHPQLTAAVITGFSSPSAEVAACQLEVHDAWSTVLGTAFDESIDPERRERIVQTLAHVWYSGLMGWTLGWRTLERAADELEDAARLLLA